MTLTIMFACDSLSSIRSIIELRCYSLTNDTAMKRDRQSFHRAQKGTAATEKTTRGWPVTETLVHMSSHTTDSISR